MSRLFLFSILKRQKKRISRGSVKQPQSSHGHKPSSSQNTFNQQQSRLRSQTFTTGVKGQGNSFHLWQKHIISATNTDSHTLSFFHARTHTHTLKIGVFIHTVIKAHGRWHGHTYPVQICQSGWSSHNYKNNNCHHHCHSFHNQYHNYCACCSRRANVTNGHTTFRQRWELKYKYLVTVLK